MSRSKAPEKTAETTITVVDLSSMIKAIADLNAAVAELQQAVVKLRAGRKAGAVRFGTTKE